jgi:hypothetical protein
VACTVQSIFWCNYQALGRFFFFFNWQSGSPWRFVRFLRVWGLYRGEFVYFSWGYIFFFKNTRRNQF